MSADNYNDALAAKARHKYVRANYDKMSTDEWVALMIATEDALRDANDTIMELNEQIADLEAGG